MLKLLMQNHPKTCCRCGLRKPGMSKMRVIFAQATELLYLCSKINSIQIPDRYMAEENSLLDKLDGLKSRFEEISTLITDPSVIGDQGRYVKLSKEYKDLERLMNARTEYAALLRNLSESKSLLLSEDDPEMKEMAREEIATCEARKPQLEEEIKLLLIPQRMPYSKYVEAQEAMRQPCLPATCCACIQSMQSAKAGKWRYQVPAKEPWEASRK